MEFHVRPRNARSQTTTFNERLAFACNRHRTSLGSRRYSDSGIPFLGWRLFDLRFRTSIGHRKTAARNPTVTFRSSSVALQTQQPPSITFPKRPPWARSRSRPPRSSKNYQTLLWLTCPRFYDLRFELTVSDLSLFQTQAESTSK